MPPITRHWLRDQGSLTERISQRCTGFNVSQIVQRSGPTLLDEAVTIGLAFKERALVRDVYLCCGSRPVVFAHSVLPQTSLSGRWIALKQLGNKSLGAVLFADPLVRRSPLQFRRLDVRHPLYRHAVRDLLSPPDYLWARRSLLMLAQRRILVTEVFLPDVFEL
ncbi:MAG: chorismate--pyruvate lyase family protein [Burkholderiales bacterium]